MRSLPLRISRIMHKQVLKFNGTLEEVYIRENYILGMFLKYIQKYQD